MQSAPNLNHAKPKPDMFGCPIDAPGHLDLAFRHLEPLKASSEMKSELVHERSWKHSRHW